MIYKFVFLFTLFSFGVIDAAEKKPAIKICPSVKNYRWNRSNITKREELQVFCNDKMLHPLKDFLPQGSECFLESDEIRCKDKEAKRQLRVCLGVPKLPEWTVRYNLKDSCVRKPLHPLSEKIDSDYRCFIRNQGILCLPKNFELERYFPSKKRKVQKVVVKDLNCPDGAEPLADVDRVFCFYKTKVQKCSYPKFKSSYQTKSICARVKGYYTHVWYFEN